MRTYAVPGGGFDVPIEQPRIDDPTATPCLLYTSDAADDSTEV